MGNDIICGLVFSGKYFCKIEHNCLFISVRWDSPEVGSLLLFAFDNQKAKIITTDFLTNDGMGYQ